MSLALNRIGKILIHKNFIEDEGGLESITPVFTKFIPIFIDPFEFQNKLVYIGYCTEFEEVPDGQEIPFYEAQITQGKNGVELKFTRQ